MLSLDKCLNRDLKLKKRKEKLRKMEKGFFNPNIYSYNNLKSVDKKAIDTARAVTDNIFAENRMEEYLSENYGGCPKTKELLKEHFALFIEYLKELTEYSICDKIIENIDSYSEEDMELIISEIKKRKQKVYCKKEEKE